MNRIHSKRPPPKVGVSSNTGRLPVRPGLPPVKGYALRGPFKPAARAGVNESVAPACPITRSELPPTQRGVMIPAVPKAVDLPSAIAAINKLIDIVATDSEATIRWLEKERVTAIVRIFNPEDDAQWVDVERIQMLLMEDQITGDLWLWELGQSAPIAPSAATVLANLDNFSRLTGSVVRPPEAG